MHAALSNEARKNLAAGQQMRQDANQAVKNILATSESSLTTEADKNLKADSGMRLERAQEKEVSPKDSNYELQVKFT